MARTEKPGLRYNLGTRKIKSLRKARYPDAGGSVTRLHRSSRSIDVLLVNPPSPDGGIWIRTQHRVGRRSREEMIWPQCSLAQLGAMLEPDYRISIIDAIAERINWEQFEERIKTLQPRYYISHVTAPTLTNDMYGIMLAKSMGAITITFGTHVTPLPVQTLEEFPCLDFVIRGEPEITFRELIDVLEDRIEDRTEFIKSLIEATRTERGTDSGRSQNNNLSNIDGLAWRDNGEIIVNQDREFIPRLDDLPVPLYEKLPLDRYRMPLMKGPFAFVVTSRGCPAGCKFCIKHVTYQWSVRILSPQRIFKEIKILHRLGVRNIHMYADLFTVNRDQVVELCQLIIQSGLKIRWTCNSRVDFVDEEMLQLMGQAGCWLISWGLESSDPEILKKAAKGTGTLQAEKALNWARRAGIKNWGYFIIGLPGETVDSIQETIRFAKRLPLEIALFHIAAPYPGTPFFFEVVEKGWFKEGTRWEQVDMDKETVLEYDNLSSEDLVYWQKRAFREWAFRPGPVWTYIKMLFTDARTFSRALRVGIEHLGWTLRSKEK